MLAAIPGSKSRLWLVTRTRNTKKFFPSNCELGSYNPMQAVTLIYHIGVTLAGWYWRIGEMKRWSKTTKVYVLVALQFSSDSVIGDAWLYCEVIWNTLAMAILLKFGWCWSESNQNVNVFLERDDGLLQTNGKFTKCDQMWLWWNWQQTAVGHIFQHILHSSAHLRKTVGYPC